MSTANHIHCSLGEGLIFPKNFYLKIEPTSQIEFLMPQKPLYYTTNPRLVGTDSKNHSICSLFVEITNILSCIYWRNMMFGVERVMTGSECGSGHDGVSENNRLILFSMLHAQARVITGNPRL